MESPPAKPVKTCSKCAKNPASNGNPWCQPCRTEHARQQRETEAAMIGARNFQAGANAIRLMMASQLERAPGTIFQAATVAKWIREFPPPEYPALKDTDSGRDSS